MQNLTLKNNCIDCHMPALPSKKIFLEVEDKAKSTPDLIRTHLISIYREQTKQYLEKITGKETKSLAFPYGSYTPETVSIAKSCGYSQLLATEFLFPGDHTDATMRERLTINPFVSNINQLHANISGHYR